MDVRTIRHNAAVLGGIGVVDPAVYHAHPWAAVEPDDALRWLLTYLQCVRSLAEGQPLLAGMSRQVASTDAFPGRFQDPAIVARKPDLVALCARAEAVLCDATGARTLASVDLERFLRGVLVRGSQHPLALPRLLTLEGGHGVSWFVHDQGWDVWRSCQAVFAWQEYASRRLLRTDPLDASLLSLVRLVGYLHDAAQHGVLDRILRRLVRNLERRARRLASGRSVPPAALYHAGLTADPADCEDGGLPSDVTSLYATVMV